MRNLIYSLSYHRTFHLQPILPQDISSTAYLTTGHFIYSLSYHRTFHPQPVLPPTFHPPYMGQFIHSPSYHRTLSSTTYLTMGHFIQSLSYHRTFHPQPILPQDISITYFTVGISAKAYLTTGYFIHRLPSNGYFSSKAHLYSQCEYWINANTEHTKSILWVWHGLVFCATL